MEALRHRELGQPSSPTPEHYIAVRLSTDAMRVLIVSTQFPFPARSGYERRVYGLARELASRHSVTLLSYARPDQLEDVRNLATELTVTVVERPLIARRQRRLMQFGSVVSRTPFAVREIHSDEMQSALNDLCARSSFDLIQLEGSVLCQFTFPANVPVILDEHNIEYELLARMRTGERSLLRRSFSGLQRNRVRRFEERCWLSVAGCAVTSAREEPLISSIAPDTPTAVVPNAADIDYFHSLNELVQPHTMAFTGVLDYRPNVDAALYLVDEIWPHVLARFPDAQLTIVGRVGEAERRRLRRPSVTLTGEVPDVRPHLARANVVGVPVRIGGGTRLKVVEGMAMGKAVVSTSLGCEGLDVIDGEHLLIANDAAAFASSVSTLFEDAERCRALGSAARALAERRYSWRLAGERLDSLYQRVLDRHARALDPDPAVPPIS